MRAHFGLPRTTALAAIAFGTLAFGSSLRTARADEAPAAPPKNVVLADLGLHVVGVGYQRTVAPRIALQADLDWYVPWTQTDEALDTMGGVLRLRPVFYLTEGAPEGLWLSPFVQGGFARAERGGADELGPAAAFGGSLGYALLVADHLHLSVGAGAQAHAVSIPGAAGAPSFFGASPHVDGTVGYAF
jgi:hypothetical protein